MKTGWQGAIAAGALLLGAHYWQTLVGSSHAVTTAGDVAILMGAIAAWMRLPERVTLGLSHASRNFALHMLLAAWLVLAPTWLGLCSQVLSSAGLGVQSPIRNALMIGLLALLTQGLPAMLALSLVRSSTAPRTDSDIETTPLPAAFCFGAGCGIAILLVFCAWLGDYLAGVLLATCGVAVAFRSWWLALESSDTPTANFSATVDSLTESKLSLPAALLDGTLCLLLGAMVAAECWVTRQLSIHSAPAQWGEILALCLGLGAGLVGARRVAADGTARFGGVGVRVLFAVTMAAACAAMLLAGFGSLVQVSLWLSSRIQSPTLLIALRALAYGWPMAAAAYATGIILGASAPGRAGAKADWRIVMLGAAWWIGLHAPLHAVNDVGGWLLLMSAVLLTLVVLRPGVAAPFPQIQTTAILETLSNLRTGRWRRLSAAAIVTALVVAPCFRLRYDPALSARVLFTGNAFVAYRNGFDSSWLTALDDARLVASRQGAAGTLTVWKSNGFRHQIRENGIPRGIVSADASQLGHYSAEVLQAVYPLVLHDKPQSVLVLGVGSGVSLSTSLEFPLQRCVCAEGDGGLRELVRNDLKRLTGTSPLDDERVEMWSADPLHATAATRETFDVIVSNPGQPALLSTQPYFTPHFYHSAAKTLANNGIFCQRWEGIDLGPVPVQTIGRQMRSAFKDVMVVEIAAGELLFLATNSPEGLIRERLYERCQSDQVRRALSHIGFDWSMLLDLPACGSEEMSKFCQPSSRLMELVQTGRMAWSTPIEVMRWAPKQQEIQAALEPHRGRLLNWLGEDAEDPLLLRRFNEVASQTKLKSTYSSQYWAYRASVREQVSAHPKTLIQRTSAGGESTGLDFEDRRRLGYFSVLSRTLKSQQAGDVHKLLSFAVPYDPLLTDFVYLEAAELAKKAKPRDVQLELRCRLHSVYFASPADTSVRTVAETLRLLREHPEAEADPRQRWDLTNSMLQTLQSRWSGRTGVAAQSTTRHVLIDIDDTLKNAELSMKEMVALTAEAGFPPSVWTTRRQVLERTLIAPVEVYKLQVQRFHREIELKE